MSKININHFYNIEDLEEQIEQEEAIENRRRSKHNKHIDFKGVTKGLKEEMQLIGGLSKAQKKIIKNKIKRIKY